MFNRWMSSRSQLRLYTLGFVSGALLVYSLSQFGHLCRMERSERDLTPILSISPIDHRSRSPVLNNNVHDYVKSGNADDIDLRQENDRGTVQSGNADDIDLRQENHRDTVQSGNADDIDLRRENHYGNVQSEANRKLDEVKPGYLNEPIDAHDYNYIHNPEYICFNKKGEMRNITILFLALTAPGHFDRREAIRATYGNASDWPSLGKYEAMQTVFLLGGISNATLQRLIDSEANHHGDIIQEDFVDSYLNLTRKTVMGLKWASNHCRHARYAMKIDDDTMMNQRRFQTTVLTKNAPLSNYTAGSALIGTKTVRKKSSKFYLSEEYYPLPTFPPYMDGPAYLLSLDIVEPAYKAALTTPMFKWEDAFIGMILQQVGAHVQRFDRFLLFRLSDKYDDYERAKKAKSYNFVSSLNADEMRWMWNLCHI